MEEEAKAYTAFITHKGMFEFEVLPFGIKNSPGVFQRSMDLIFGDLYGREVLTYIDDIIIFSNDEDQHYKLLGEVLRRCVEAGLFLRLSKSEVARPEVRLLGHRVSLDGIRPDEAKVESIRKAVAPDSKETLRSFLGTIGYLRQYIPNFSQITAPLNDLLKKGAEYTWTSGHGEIFEHLKEELCDKVLLCAPRGDGPLIIVCDASNRGIGCALLQMQQGDPVLLEFGSKKLSIAEQKWDTREREAFAIKWSLERFFDFTRAFPVIVVTDHESLRWMESSTCGKIQRWSLYMQQFDLRIVHLFGKMNVIADWLSRSIDADVEDSDQALVPSFPVTSEEPKDPEYLPLLCQGSSNFAMGTRRAVPVTSSRHIWAWTASDMVHGQTSCLCPRVYEKTSCIGFMHQNMEDIVELIGRCVELRCGYGGQEWPLMFGNSCRNV